MPNVVLRTTPIPSNPPPKSSNFEGSRSHQARTRAPARSFLFAVVSVKDHESNPAGVATEIS